MFSLRTLSRRVSELLRQTFQTTETVAVREQYPRLYDSHLETRRVLNGDALPADLLALVISAGNEASDGTADRFDVTGHESNGVQQISISVNDKQVWQGNASELQSLHLQGSSDRDMFTIDSSIHFAGLLTIDGGAGPAAAQSTDLVVIAPGADHLWQSITAQQSTDMISLRFVAYAQAETNTTTNDQLWHIANVGQIIDHASAVDRAFVLDDTQSSWTLTSSTLDHSSMLMLTSDNMHHARYDFRAPENGLIISSLSGAGVSQSLTLANLDLSSLNSMQILGDRQDVLVQTGWLKASHTLDWNSGSAQLSGHIDSNSATNLFVHASTITQSGSIDLRSGSRLLFDAGATGQTRVDGQFSIRGNERIAGGVISLLGDKVELGSAALVDVSGLVGGGQVFIGGGQAGNDPSMLNATNVTLVAGARVTADALANGHGGRIIVYSAGHATIENASGLSARGGAQFGSGGFIETSGKQHLTMRGTPSLSAPVGRGGQWLIDPESISIVSVLPPVPDPAISYTLVSDLLDLLNAGGDVVLETSTADANKGDIVIDANILAIPAVNAKLILKAARDIVINNPVSGNSFLGLQMEAVRNVNASAALTGFNYVKVTSTGDTNVTSITTLSGSLNAGTGISISAKTLTASGSLTTTGGHIELTGTNAAATSLNLQAIEASGGLVALAAANNIVLGGGANSIKSTGGGGSLTIRGTAAATTIGIGTGAAGSVNLSDSSVAAIGAGFTAGIKFGSTGQSGKVTFAGATQSYDQSLFVQASGGANVDILTSLQTTENSAAGKVINIASTAASVVKLAGNLTTAGGDVTISAGTLLVDGSAARTITTGGTGLTANTAGNVSFNGLIAIDGVTSAADLTIDARGVLNGGTVRLTSVTNTGTGLRNFTVDTRGSTNNGRTFIDNGIAGDTTVDVSGNLSLANTEITLTDNLLLTTHGDTSLLSLGAALHDNTSHNLQLTSDASISTGKIDLKDGTLTIQVDVDNDTVSSFNSSGTLSAGSIQISGSLAKNDTLNAQSAMTATTGSIQFNSFDLVQLGGTVKALTSVTATNVNTVELKSSVDVTAGGAIDFVTSVAAVLLSGSTGSTNSLESTGANAFVGLAALTATNNNVDLKVNSDRSVSFQSVAMAGGQLDVIFSLANPANTSSVSFTSTLIADGLSVTGAARTNDAVTFGSTFTLGAAGLSVSQVATTQVSGSVTTTTGAIIIASATSTTLAGNLTTAGGNVTISGGKLLIDGTAARTITTGGSGLTANTGGNVTLNGLSSIDGVNAVADLTIDARGILAGGTVRLTSVTNTGTGLRNLTIDTRGSNSTGQTIFDNGIVGDTTVDVSGSLSLNNTAILMTDNLALTTHGDTSLLSLGAVTNDGVSHNLQLISDAGITTAGIDVKNGTLTIEVDVDDDSISGFTSSGALIAGTIQISGSAAKNDTLNAQAALTASTGAIQLNNFSLVQLGGNVDAFGSVTATNVTTVELKSSVAVTALGAIDFVTSVTAILLSGNSGTTNTLDSSGASASVGLAAISTTNNNVDLKVNSDRSVNLKAVTLTGGQLDVLFSRDNAANNSSVSFASTVTADGLSVIGASRTNDAVTFGSTLTLGAAGLSVSQVATTQVSGNVTTTTGAIAIASATSTTLAANLTTAGGSVTISGGKLLIDGAAARTITTGGSGLTANTGGNVTLNGLTTIDGVTAPADLTIDARGIVTGGTVRLTTIANVGTGLRNLTIDSRGSTTTGNTIFDNGVAGDTTVDVSGSLSLANTAILLTDNLSLTTRGDASNLSLGSVIHNGTSRNLLLTSEASVSTGSVDLKDGTLTIQVDVDNDSIASFSSSGALSAGTLTISGSAAGNDSFNAQSTLTATTGAIQLTDFNLAQLGGNVNAAGSVTATNVSTVELKSNVSVTAAGAIDFATSVGAILLSGTSGSVNTLDSTGTNASVALAAITSTNNNVDLKVNSDRSVNLKAVTLTGGQLDVLFSRDNAANNSSVTFASTVIADGLNVTGVSRTNDTVTFVSTLTLGAAGLSVSQVATTLVSADVTTTTGAINIASATLTTLVANLTTAGGNVMISGGRLLIDGAAARTITTGGAGLTASTAGNVTLNGTAIDGVTSPADLTIDARGLVNGGTVRLTSVTNTGTGLRNLVVDTRGSTITGQTVLDNGVAGDTTLNVSGNLALHNTRLLLTDNVALTTRGDANLLSLGTVTNDGTSHNLQLTSDASITTAGIDLKDGALTIQVDVDDDSISSLTSSGVLSAGTIQISGSAAQNDTFNAQLALTATTGAIQLTNFNLIQLGGNVFAQGSVIASNVTTVELKSDVSITAVGAIDLATSVTGILLSGLAGTTNTLDSSGASASINLTAITSTNNNVDLKVNSDRSASFKSIALTGGQVDVVFSRVNAANNSSVTFASTVSADGLNVTGASRSNDTVTFSSPLTIAAAGLNVSQVATTLVAGNVTTTTGAISIASTTATTLAANFRTSGGNVTISGGTLLIDGTAGRTIATGSNGANTGGNIDLSSLTSIDGVTAVGSLQLNSQGLQTGGSVKLASVTANNLGLNSLSIDSNSNVDGIVQLGNIRLVATNVPSLLSVNSGDVTPTAIRAAGIIDLRSSTVGVAGGTINCGRSIIVPNAAGSSLSLLANHTASDGIANGSNGGSIFIGAVGGNGAIYFDSLTVNTTAADALDQGGLLSLQATNPTLATGGSSGGNANLVGIQIIGAIKVNPNEILTLTTNGNSTVGLNSRAIDLRQITLVNNHDVVIDTSSSNRSAIAGNVLLGDVGKVVRPINLTIDTRGTTSTGRTIINNGVAGGTTIDVDGVLAWTNTTVQLADDAQVTTHGDSSLLNLGQVITDGSARNLQLISDTSVLTGGVSLSGGNYVVQIDTDDDSVSSFTSSGAIAAGSVQISGSAAQNDTFVAQSTITATTGFVRLNNFTSAQLGGDVQSQSDVTVTNVNTLELKSDVDVTAAGDINLDSTVGNILLSGTSGTGNILDATGLGSDVNLAAVTSTNTNVDLTVRSDRSVNLKSVTLNGGQVDVLFSRNNPPNDSIVNLSGTINSDGLRITGAGRTADMVVVSSLLTLGAAGLDVSQVATVLLNANITATGSARIRQISDRIDLIGNGQITAGGDIDLRTGVNRLNLLGAAATVNRLTSTGDSATIQLSTVVGASGANLELLSNRHVTVTSIDLAGAARLLIEVDRNNNNSGSQLNLGTAKAGSISLIGSNLDDDVATVTSTLQARTGGILVTHFATVTLNDDVTSATEITAASIAQQLRLAGNVDLLAAAGAITLQLGNGQIFLVGGPGTSNIFDARASMSLSQVVSTVTVSANLFADGDVNLSGSGLVGSLTVTAGNHAAPAGRIESSSVLRATSLDLRAATGIGAGSPLSTIATNIAATNRISGDIRLTNETSLLTEVTNLSTLAGGNILFNQTGGGAARFQHVETNRDATPGVNETIIDISVIGADLTLTGTGLISDGLGPVSLKTLNVGNLNLLSGLQAAGSNVLLQSAKAILGSGQVTSTTLGLVATEAIGGATALRTQTSQVTAATVLGAINLNNVSPNTVVVTELRNLAGGSITFVQSGGGDLQIGNLISGNLANPNIQITSSDASMKLGGLASASGTGGVKLVAQRDLTLASTSRIVTHDAAALVEGIAGGKFHFEPGAVVRVGTGTPATEAVMTQLPPRVRLLPVVNSQGVNVDSEGLGVIDILLSPSPFGVTDQNYALTINWGGGAIDVLPSGARDPNTTGPAVTRFDASSQAYRFSHQYLQNPNTGDPTANIGVQVTASVDSLNRIRFSDSQGAADSLSATATFELLVPSTGLISLYFVLPQTPTIQKQLVFARDTTEVVSAQATVVDRANALPTSSSNSSVQQPRRFVLRLMTPVDEFGRVEASKDPKDDIPLSPEDIANLDGLFARLSDNRYRIYVVLEDGNELLLKDILLRNHQPAEVEELPQLLSDDRAEIPLLDKATR